MILCPSCQSIKIVKIGKTYTVGRIISAKLWLTVGVQQQSLHHKRSARNDPQSPESTDQSAGYMLIFFGKLPWLLDFGELVWKEVPMDIGLNNLWLKKLRPEKAQFIVIQLDEAWSFVDNKKQKRWIWGVFDPVNRLVVAFQIGNRGKESAKALLCKIPVGYKRKCFFATD
ncbi:IS1 family transposase [Flavilitoribacter nigricans]|uniref:IS1 family transposase n=1 Tax=Flavilitoribacter nigricans (strain ATCC 23147 / DSM 23189 / NBRC 102662 / NCIMB 1420 / SS-2) TaxID=1122177 RepID=A0A2D0NKR0_FLAN2|nr:IS1 family transposase [Flavilitoribacter nigricans]PHN08323.1 hypothetical protein CRP01_03090 [Flavilitoribacter nigricans DSM 23189 = NBRC 102662]